MVQNLNYRDDGTTRDGDMDPVGFSDADWASNLDNRRSTSGYLFFLGGSPISWRSKLQAIVAKSSAESEYVALSATVAEAIWIKSLMEELKIPIGKTSMIYGDNQASLCIAKNRGSGHTRTKHIDVKHHFIRDYIENEQISVKYCSTLCNVADLMTKSIVSVKLFEDLRDKAMGHKDPFDFTG